MNQNVLAQKQEQVSEIANLIKGSQAVLICEYRGLTVAEVSALRKGLREKKACARVYKNSLVERAMDSLGDEGLDGYLSGPNMLIFFEDFTNGSLRDVAKFARKNEAFTIKGGVFEGRICEPDYIKGLSQIPGKEGLVSMMLSVLQAPLRNLAYSLSQVSERK